MKKFATIIILIFLTFLFSTKVGAIDTEPKITLKTSTDSVNVNNEFYIYVTGENLNNLYTLSFDMKFNPKVIEVLSVEPGEFLKGEKFEFNSSYDLINEDVKLVNFFETFTGVSNGKSSLSNTELVKIKVKLLKECKLPLQIINTNSDLYIGTPNFRIVLVDNLLNKINFPSITRYIETKNFSTDDDIREFISNVYKKTFSRDPDEYGFDYWYKKLISYEYSVRGFLINILSEKEFIDKNLSNEEFITAMYSIITNREPDEIGYSYWLNLLTEYQSKMDQKLAKSYIILRICNEAELEAISSRMNLKF